MQAAPFSAMHSGELRHSLRCSAFAKIATGLVAALMLLGCAAWHSGSGVVAESEPAHARELSAVHTVDEQELSMLVEKLLQRSPEGLNMHSTGLDQTALGKGIPFIGGLRGAKPKGRKVVVCGGAGGIGQPLSAFMAMDPNVGELCIFDLSIAMVPPAGVAADLSHLETDVNVKGHVMELGAKPKDNLQECLTGADLVLIPAGMPRKPGQTRDDLFKVNADIAKGLVEACANFCPNAMLALIVNPVNSIVPAMAELYKKKGLDPSKIVGVTTLDCVRANKFVAVNSGKSAQDIEIPVIGGHAGVTILPLFSQDGAGRSIDASKIPDLDKRVQDAGTEVVNAKNGKGSATLSMAYAGARLGSSILSGLTGKRKTECAYVMSDACEGLPFFAGKVVFGKKGVVKCCPIGKLSAHEKTRLEEVKAALTKEINSGLEYAKVNDLNITKR
eukprot:gnl/TRDRNA2_/TRDRNA2_176421_c0_seq2.p1 gnl/TRDRNA2_/TRDRNA2_176421_c0~~gnl/TRDRNA2_/TRDRNA2_176421_c0_seq2.p1  ORF type:complete len:445 (-),score=93.94 gnl/TRDRNA2_/TRDRNA2_176421_c0_seq2:166-1500(-)